MIAGAVAFEKLPSLVIKPEVNRFRFCLGEGERQVNQHFIWNVHGAFTVNYGWPLAPWFVTDAASLCYTGQRGNLAAPDLSVIPVVVQHEVLAGCQENFS